MNASPLLAKTLTLKKPDQPTCTTRGYVDFPRDEMAATTVDHPVRDTNNALVNAGHSGRQFYKPDLPAMMTRDAQEPSSVWTDRCE